MFPGYYYKSGISASLKLKGFAGCWCRPRATGSQNLYEVAFPRMALGLGLADPRNQALSGRGSSSLAVHPRGRSDQNAPCRQLFETKELLQNGSRQHDRGHDRHPSWVHRTCTMVLKGRGVLHQRSCRSTGQDFVLIPS